MTDPKGLRPPSLTGKPRCDVTGKRQLSQKDAKLVARALREQGGQPTVYKCRACPFYHVSGEHSVK